MCDGFSCRPPQRGHGSVAATYFWPATYQCRRTPAVAEFGSGHGFVVAGIGRRTEGCRRRIVRGGFGSERGPVDGVRTQSCGDLGATMGPVALRLATRSARPGTSVRRYCAGHLDDRRAGRRTRGFGQPQPGRAGPLCVFGVPVRSRRAFATRWLRPGRAGLRGAGTGGLANDAGFSRFRRVAQTSFNLVYEARL